MSNEQYTLRSIDVNRDCEKLVEMWHASDLEWPGSWTQGTAMQAWQIRDWHEREEYLDVFVWDTGDKIAGYCSLIYSQDEDQLIYLALLNVSPEFQGHSLGRKFLTHCVDRVVELKKTRLDLDTWSGNLKAVPLYKKSGFFWDPGPDVAMRNYIPAILQMPCAKSYFEKHDWYRTLHRELTQTEDDETWEGLRVFTYHFEAGGDQLTVWADREARTIAAVDTDELFAAALVDNIEPIRGYDATMRWKLTNKRQTPMEVLLIAHGAKDLSIDHRESCRIAPGESAEMTAKVSISDKADTPGRVKSAPAVSTLLLIDNEPVELATGIRPRAPLEMSIHPEHIALLPGTSQTIHLNFRNRFPQDVEAHISITPSAGLTTDLTQQTVTLPANGYAGLPVILEAQIGGVFELSASIRCEVDGKTVDLPADTYAVFSLPPGGMLAAQTGGSIRIENETVRAVMSTSKGCLTISDPRTGKQVATHNARPTPPEWPTEYDKKDFTLKLEREDNTVVATASVKSDKYSGFVFHKIVRMNAGPIITIDHEFENTGPDARSFRLSGSVGNNNMTHSTLTLPLVSGFLQGPCGDFPGTDGANRDPVYAEQWAAYEHPQITIGVFWPDDVEEFAWNWHCGMTTRPNDCTPQSLTRTGRLHLYVGDGDWSTVQRTWQRMQGHTISVGDMRPEASATLSAGFDPPVAVAENGQARVMLKVVHGVPRKCSGEARMVLPEGWSMDGAERVASFADLNWDKPFEHPLVLTAAASPGSSVGRIEVRSSDYDADFEAPFIRLGDGQAVAVRDHETDGHRVWTIANGRVEVDVTPSFAGTVSAMRENGVNHLASSFPEEEAFHWLHPWHGGIMTMIHVPGERYPGIAASETFEASEVSQTDGYGITWYGVRQRSALAHEEARGLILELDTLTVGGSPIVKHVLRLVNETTSVRKIEAGWIAFVQPDGDMSNTALHAEGYQRNRSPRSPSIDGKHWAAAQNPDTGRAIALVSPTLSVAIDDWGTGGGHLKQRLHHTVLPEDKIEMTGYFAIAENRDEMQGYAALRHVV